MAPPERNLQHDPLVAAIQAARAMIDSGVSHSRRAYQVPPAKDIVGYEFPIRKKEKRTA